MSQPSPPASTSAVPSGRWQRLRLPLGIGASTLLATAIVASFDPHHPGSYGICPSRALGLYCPGCGALRATYDLAHGDLAGAWAMNPLWVIAMPAVVVLWGLWVSRAWRGTQARPVPRWLGVLLMVVFVLFGALRNFPAFADILGPPR